MLENRATLDRFRAGDRAVLGDVYREHAPAVASLVARGFNFRSGDEVQRFFGYRAPHEQQDAVQEVFIRAFSERGRASYDGITPYGAYLRGIVKNLVVDDFRKKRAALNVFATPRASSGSGSDGDVVDALDDVDRTASPAEPADVEVHRKALSEAMKGFVDGLPEREKRFVALRYTEGLAQEDVAKRLRVGRSTVRTLEERVRRRLHERLQKRGLLEEPPRSAIGRVFGRLLPALVVTAGFVCAVSFAEVLHG